MKYFDYNSKKLIPAKESKTLSLLYNCFIGRVLLKLLTTKTLANIYRFYITSSLSKLKIKRFVQKNNIDISRYENACYKSFNDFFIRKIKQEKKNLDKGFISPCDAKLSVYKIDEDLSLNIKNSIYTLDELVEENVDDFKGGYCLVYRLCVDDYHRYIYPFDGSVIKTKHILGKLHTVQPIAQKKYKVFKENDREITLVKNKKYEEVYIIEVGAMMIGKIVNNKCDNFKKGDEKGHFEFGGSTIIYLFKKDKINLNEIILNNSKNDIETIVKIGDNLE